MRQVLQSLQNGLVRAAEVPCPAAARNRVLIRTCATLISSGTERMLMEFGKAGWIDKARQQPDRFKQVIAKAKVDGIVATLESVQAKLAQPIPLGYSNAGIVLEVGSNVSEFQPGDRVISNGAHAEVVSVPKHLCARIPDHVGDEPASFTVLGAISLEGIRLAQPALGESVAVIGLGLIGLLTVQLLRASGCRVLAIDYNRSRLQLAESFGAQTVDIGSGQDPVSAALRFSGGHGMDAVLITAATKSNEPVHQSALMSRKRGRVILVGVAGLEISRDDFYKKELTFQVSCSYGPGRYDSAYEEGGQDYPLPYVRWTAQRNFEAVLAMLAAGSIHTGELVSHRIPFDRVSEAYALIERGEPHLGIVLEYPIADVSADSNLRAETIRIVSSKPLLANHANAPVIGFLGAGNYASKVLIPAFKKAGAELDLIVSSGGVSASSAAGRFGFKKAGSNSDAVFSNPVIQLAAIATRHDSHARYVTEALRHGKAVFVEKPLALTLDEVDDIEQQYASARVNGQNPWVLVGFNRRFAPLVRKMKELIEHLDEPKQIVITVNAGAAASGDWTLDPVSGGGRILGEGCHFVDLLRFLAGGPSCALHPVKRPAKSAISDDSLTFSIAFEDGSVGTVHYLTVGHRAFPKERVEVFCAGKTLQLDNFRSLRGWGFPRFQSMKLWKQDKGAFQMASAAIEALRLGGPSPIPFAELLEVGRLAIELAHA